MGITRGIANVATFGAAGRVDDAIASYKAAIGRYNEHKRLKKEIKSLQGKVHQLKDELDKKAHIIRKMYSQETRKHLSSMDEDALQKYKNCTNNLPAIPDFSYELIREDTDWTDDACNNLAITFATIVLSGIGLIAANSLANEKILEIQKKEKEVIEATKKIQPQIIALEKVKTKYESAIEVLLKVKSIVKRFGGE